MEKTDMRYPNTATYHVENTGDVYKSVQCDYDCAVLDIRENRGVKFTASDFQTSRALFRHWRERI